VVHTLVQEKKDFRKYVASGNVRDVALGNGEPIPFNTAIVASTGDVVRGALVLVAPRVRCN